MQIYLIAKGISRACYLIFTDVEVNFHQGSSSLTITTHFYDIIGELSLHVSLSENEAAPR